MIEKDLAIRRMMSKTQFRQIQALIKYLLQHSEFALTPKEIHSERQLKFEYDRTMDMTRRAIWTLSKNKEIIYYNKKGEGLHYFVI